MTEEDVKARIILPQLAKWGFDASELQLESSFRLNLGRHVLDLTSGKQVGEEVGARLDILVSRAGLNLFVIETKHGNSALDHADRDQAISYARLVHPIAPYAVVTNGNEWCLYDTVTKNDIAAGSFTAANAAFSIALPEEAKEEALQFFLGFSLPNLLKFCQLQLAEALTPLKGSPTDLSKKFIPELHVPHKELTKHVLQFLNGSSSGLVVTADSGMGKTSEMCYLAEELSSNGIPVLFFQGWLIENGLLEQIATEFNWAFPEQNATATLIKKIAALTKNHPIVVIVDAIDEWEYPQKVTNLLNALRFSQAQLKIIVSCKSTAWAAFSMQRGSNTGIANFLAHSGASETFSLGEMSDQRFRDAVSRYEQVFQVSPKLEGSLLAEMQRNPFLLRVAFEVAKSKGTDTITFSSFDLFDQYYHRLLQKTRTGEQGESQLIAVAKALFENNSDTLERNVLRHAIGLRMTESIEPALFDYNLLSRSAGSAVHVGFYFQQLRDFVICFKVLNIPQMSSADFKRFEKSLSCDGAQADLLTFYYRHASEEHLRVLDGQVFGNAQKYLQFYSKIVEQDFPALREYFRPHTTGLIGFIGEFVLPRRAVGMYAFRSKRADEPAIFFVPVGSTFGDHRLMALHGSSYAHFSSTANGFVELNVEKEVIDHEIQPQLKSMVSTKSVNEFACLNLLLEDLCAILLANPKIFPDFLTARVNRSPNPALEAARARGLPVDPYQLLAFPLDYDKACQAIRRAKLSEYFYQKAWVEKRTFELTPEEGQRVRQDVAAALRNNHDVITKSPLQRLDERICGITTVLKKSGCSAKSLWIERSQLFDAFTESSERGLALFREHLFNLFTAFLEDYPKLLDTNFPTFANEIVMRQSFPIVVFLGIDEQELIKSFERGVFFTNAVDIYLCKPNSRGDENQVFVLNAAEVEHKFVGFVTVKGVRYDLVASRGFDLSRMTFDSGGNKGTPVERQSRPLHFLIYDELESQVPRMVNALRRRYSLGEGSTPW